MRNTKDKIIQFWFEETQPQQWFQNNSDFDAQIADSFAETYDMAENDLFKEWERDAGGCLALVIVLDQFPRNMFRGKAKAFATDHKALLISKQAIHKGFDQILSPVKRRFLYMPYMHSEHFQDQKKSLELFGALQDIDPIGYKHAKRHYEEIEKFGRFPYRNAALGRESEPDEIEYLKTLYHHN